MSETPEVSRRTMMGGLGVAGLGMAGLTGMVLAGPASGLAATSGRTFAPTRGRLDVESPLPNAFKYTRLAAADFRPSTSTAAWELTNGALTTTSTGTFVATFSPAYRDQLTELLVFLDPGGHTGTIRLRCEAPEGVTDAVTGTYGPGTGLTTVYLPIPNQPYYTDPETCAYTVSIDLQPGVVLRGARINYFSATRTLVMLDEPIRVWDSRTPDGSLINPGAGAGGKIAGGQAVWFTLDPVITRYAYSVLLNVTLDATEGSGYLTVWGRVDEDDPPPPHSNINWYANGQIVANLVVAEMVGEADVTITAGGPGRTHFIVDLFGYLV